jgi:hypothetical protein
VTPPAPPAGPPAPPAGPPDDDTRQVGELGGALPALDVDTTTAEMIARRARASVGKPPPRRRWIVPILAGVATAAYATWMILKALEVLT